MTTRRPISLVAMIFATAIASLTACSGIGGGRPSTWIPADAPPDGRQTKKLVVTSSKDGVPGSLRAEVASAPKGASITFDLHLPAKLVLTRGAIDLKESVTITGPGATKLSISGGNKSQIFVVSAHATVKLTGMQLVDGAARAGATPSGGAIYSSGKLTLESDTFSNNFAESAAAAEADTRLAVMKARFDPRPRVRDGRAPRPPRAPRLRVPHQSTAGEGGAVYNAGQLTIENSTFSKNTVQEGYGGAVYNSPTAVLTASGSKFSSNVGAQGGALFNAGTATLTSDAFDTNTGWPGGGAPFCCGQGYGGAVDAGGGSLAIAACTFEKNVAGGVAQQSYGLGGALAHGGGSLVINNTQFIGNLAGGGTNGSWGYGGAIFDESPSGLTLSGNTFTSNDAGGDAFGYGGAIYSEATFKDTGDAFNTNSAYGTSNGGYGYGGAIYAAGGVTIAGSSFSTNMASGGSASNYGYSYGGAIDTEQTSTLTAVTFTANAATGGAGGSGEGGAVFVDGGTGTWLGVAFSQNVASATGASSFAAGGGVATFAPLSIGATSTSASSFSSNVARAATTGALGGVGGALAVEEGPFSFTGSAVGNQATTQGGGIWIDDVAAITNSAFSANAVLGVQAHNDGGGGLYNAIGAVLTLAGSTLDENTVAGSVTSTGGAGIFNAGIATITNCTVTLNASSVDGGGMENDANGVYGSVTLNNVTLYANSAASSGQNLKNLYSDASMTIANTIIGGGASDLGGDVSNDGTLASNDYNIVQTAPTGNAISGTTAHDQQVDPILSPLAQNGGPTQTNADQAGGPGTAYVPYSGTSCGNALNIVTDQRGDPRNPLSQGKCDVGAYENQNP